MTAPLMMIGPGGDYVTRFDVKGDGLVKTRAQQSAAHDRDNESAGNGVAWGFLGRRNKKKAQAKATRLAADRFEHTEQPTLPATYAKPALADPQQQLAMIQAIQSWFTSQQAELDRLAAIQTATEAQLAETASAAGSKAASTTNTAAPQSAPAPIRVIRFNSTTMDMPTPAPTLTPEPCHAFATLDAAADTTLEQDNPTQPQRSVEHDQPQPHAQANENFDINSRHPAIARLFADDERARRSARRLQSNHLRTRRSTHQKGLPGQGCEQGALFGAVA